MEEESGPSIEDYLDIVYRRKFLFIFTVPVLLFISVIIALILPPIFKSQGLILIQGQEIPEDLVKSTVSSFAEEQIETTRQRIMTTTKIMEIIDTHNLYPELRDKGSIHQIAANFRDSMGVQMISAQAPGHGAEANVAFIVSFMDKDPFVAQKVANELTTLFLEENIKARTSKADETAQFLEEEANRMQARVQEIENKIAEFKIKYAGSLPDLLPFNLETVERIEEQLVDTQDETIRISDRIHQLNIELSNISPYVQYSTSSGASLTPRQRLMELRNQYSQQIIVYAESHPDIVRLKDEIAIAEKEVANISEDIDSEEAANPVYRRMQANIEAEEKELKRLNDRRQKLEADLVDYNQRVATTHHVKRNYDELTRDYTNKLEKYQELRAKQLEANVAQNMEAENKAGSFKLIEPPTVSEVPEKPNRLKLLLMGVVFSFGAGFGLMIVAEFLDPGIRGVSNVTRVMGQTPLAVVSHISNTHDTKLRSRNRRKLIWIFCAGCFVSILLFHFLVMSLDLLWLKVMSKISAV